MGCHCLLRLPSLGLLKCSLIFFHLIFKSCDGETGPEETVSALKKEKDHHLLCHKDFQRGFIKNQKAGTSLVVQWLRVHGPSVWGPGLIPGQGIKILQAAQRGQNPNLEIKQGSPALQADPLPAEPPGKPFPGNPSINVKSNLLIP